MASKIEVPSELPGMYGSKASTQTFFDRSARKDVDRAHWKIAFFTMVIVALGLAGAIAAMMPLKTVKIYRLDVDKLGVQAVAGMSSGEYSPSENEIRSRLKEAVERMISIDPRLMKRNLQKVETMMSGQARKQFKEYLSSERPFTRIVEHPDLIREVQVNGVSKIAEKVYLVDFVTKERTGQSEPIVKRNTITVSYEIKPAKTDEEVLGDNPAGIYIVSFTISVIN